MLKSPKTAIKSILLYSRYYHSSLPNEYSRNGFISIKQEAVNWYKRIAVNPRILSIDTMVKIKMVQPYWASAIGDLAQMICRQRIPEGFLNLRIIQSNMVPLFWLVISFQQILSTLSVRVTIGAAYLMPRGIWSISSSPASIGSVCDVHTTLAATDTIFFR